MKFKYLYNSKELQDELELNKFDGKQFTRVEDYWVHKKTGSIYKKSHTSHGNPGNTGTQWKIYPKNTTEFGKQAKKAAYRVTIDLNGNVVGH